MSAVVAGDASCGHKHRAMARKECVQVDVRLYELLLLCVLLSVAWLLYGPPGESCWRWLTEPMHSVH